MKKGRILCSSDWHGSAIGFRILNSLKEGDTLYFLGDAGDRGKYGYELIEALLDHPQVVYLKGNHEDLMVDALSDAFKDYDEYYFYSILHNSHWFFNGGEKTYENLLLKENYNDTVVLAKLRTLIKRLENLPTKIELHDSNNNRNIILEHAGYTPGVQYRSHDPLWDREHFNDYWSEDEEYKNTYIIHGHTPVQYLNYVYGYNGRPPFTKEDFEAKYEWIAHGTTKVPPTILTYCDGHKIDLDLCTIISNKIALFDLETFEVEYFEGEEDA